MIQVFTQPLKNPVVISDGWRLILTGGKVTLQLRIKYYKLLKNDQVNMNEKCLFCLVNF